MKVPLAVSLVLAASLAGCVGDEEADLGTATSDLASVVGQRTADEIAARAALVPRNYTFLEQEARPTIRTWKNGTVDASAATAYEDRNDRSGTHWGVKVAAEDYSGFIPPGQPVEIRIKLYAAMQPGSSADLDIHVDVPGTKSDFDPTSQDEFNWKFTAKHKTVSTVGVPGAKHEIGVAVANGKVVPGRDLAYALELEFTYLQDVLTPFHPWQIVVPEGASGLIFESVKGAGPEHVKAHFVLVGPDDLPVQVVEFNDIALQSESVFVPTTKPGPHVFYAWSMEGGFLSVLADVPVPDRVVRALDLVTESVVDATGPAPGVPSRDWTHDGAVRTPGVTGGSSTFSVAGAFPLRIEPTLSDGATAGTEARISSSLGLVASLQRVLRVDQGQDHAGYTRDEYNSVFIPGNLATGEYRVEFVNDSPNVQVGHRVVTYARE